MIEASYGGSAIGWPRSSGTEEERYWQQKEHQPNQWQEHSYYMR